MSCCVLFQAPIFNPFQIFNNLSFQSWSSKISILNASWSIERQISRGNLKEKVKDVVKGKPTLKVTFGKKQ